MTGRPSSGTLMVLPHIDAGRRGLAIRERRGRGGLLGRVCHLAVALVLLLAPLSCTSQGGTHVSGHALDEFYAPGTAAAALAAAAARGDTAEVAALVRRGANPNAVGREGMTPLAWAILAHNLDGGRALLAAGADPNRRDPDGYSALGLAIARDQPDMLALLLEHGGNPNGPGWEGYPLLFDAMSTRKGNLVRLLAEHGADLNARGPAGTTSLIDAAILNQFDTARYLVERGADWRIKTSSGLTLAYLVSSRELDPQFEPAYSAQRWLRSFLEQHGVRFPVLEPAEQRRLDSARGKAPAL